MNNIDMDQEVKQIMNRIDDYENKKKKTKFIKPLAVVAAIAILCLLPLFSNHDNSYAITRINANEYRLNVFGNRTYFKLFGFVENQNQIQLNDYIYTYEDQTKYFDITNQLDVDLLEIEDYLFITLSKKDEDEVLQYLFVNHVNDKALAIEPIRREFTNFEQEMSDIIELTKQYPFEVVQEGELLCPQYNANKKINELGDEELKDYEWFQGLKNSLVCSSATIDSILYEVIFDGTVENIGNVTPDMQMVTGGSTTGQMRKIFPITIEGKEDLKQFGDISDEEELLIEIQKNYFNDENPQGVLGIEIDFQKLNPSKYDIVIEFDGKPLKMLSVMQNESKVYLISDILTNVSRLQKDKNEDGEIELSRVYDKITKVTITDKESHEIIKEYEDHNSYVDVTIE